jgi:hypothetical protein
LLLFEFVCFFCVFLCVYFLLTTLHYRPHLKFHIFIFPSNINLLKKCHTTFWKYQFWEFSNFRFLTWVGDISKFYPSPLARDKILISANPCWNSQHILAFALSTTFKISYIYFSFKYKFVEKMSYNILKIPILRIFEFSIFLQYYINWAKCRVTFKKKNS